LKKRTKKLLVISSSWRLGRVRRAKEQKFFVSFFQERNSSLLRQRTYAGWR
jgi:hypothetical protein